jgi:hypothetical protein
VKGRDQSFPASGARRGVVERLVVEVAFGVALARLDVGFAAPFAAVALRVILRVRGFGGAASEID